ncbi:hypothetical protein RRG08_052856 [Elysia crispata]|uniref:Uncharacterized protein n=1 Tax=Elysia crispata TaxID=231223 RepID=A0AAE0XMV8_9GAST|nr:hypothetical protein RRG08_052856 [Elysia crispata]
MHTTQKVMRASTCAVQHCYIVSPLPLQFTGITQHSSGRQKRAVVEQYVSTTLDMTLSHLTIYASQFAAHFGMTFRGDEVSKVVYSLQLIVALTSLCGERRSQAMIGPGEKGVNCEQPCLLPLSCETGECLTPDYIVTECVICEEQTSQKQLTEDRRFGKETG